MAFQPERRLSKRELCRVKASFSTEEGAAFPCVIRDRSEGGMRLLFPDPVELPPEGYVVTPTTRRRVRVVWVAERQCGVAFMTD